MQIASPNHDSTDEPDEPTDNDPERTATTPGEDSGRIEPAGSCKTPSCWNTDNLQLVKIDANAEPVTLCWPCRKRRWGISS